MLKNVVYLKEEDYIKLKTNGTVEVNGQTITYSDNDIYMTPDDTDEKLAAMEAKIYENGLNVGTKIYKHFINVTLIGEEVTYSDLPDEPPFQSIHDYTIEYYSTKSNTGDLEVVMVDDEYVHLLRMQIFMSDTLSQPTVWYGDEYGTAFQNGVMSPSIGYYKYPGVVYDYDLMEDFVVTNGTKIVDYEMTEYVSEIKNN